MRQRFFLAIWQPLNRFFHPIKLEGGKVDRFNRYAKSQSVQEIRKPVDALNNLLFLIRQTPDDSQHLELYLSLAEKELERLKMTLRQGVEDPSRLM